MMSVRVVFCCVMIFLLPSCSINSLYGQESGNTTQDLHNIYVATIEDRQGQILRNKLIQLLQPNGPAKEMKYALKVSLKNTVAQLGILKDATSSLTQFNYHVTFDLIDRCSREVCFSGYTEMTAYYHTIPTSPFSTLTESEFAKKAVIIRLAYDIRRKIAAYFFLLSKDNKKAGKVDKNEEEASISRSAK